MCAYPLSHARDRCALPRPEDDELTPLSAEERTITLKPGDMLGPLALEWFASIRASLDCAHRLLLHVLCPPRAFVA